MSVHFPVICAIDKAPRYLIEYFPLFTVLLVGGVIWSHCVISASLRKQKNMQFRMIALYIDCIVFL